MIEKLKENLWRLNFTEFGSTSYILRKNGKIIMVDTGSELNREELKKDLTEIKIKPSEINIIILTHNHYDHVENIELFKNAKIYGSKKDFHKNKILDINELKLNGIIIIETPGHTPGSVCFYLPDEKLLFSGDTIFYNGFVGRTDLQGGSEEELMKSLEKIKKLDYKTLLPGHI